MASERRRKHPGAGGVRFRNLKFRFEILLLPDDFTLDGFGIIRLRALSALCVRKRLYPHLFNVAANASLCLSSHDRERPI